MLSCFRRSLAVIAAAVLTILPAGPAFADGSQTATPALGRDLPGKCLLRPLFRILSRGSKSSG